MNITFGSGSNTLKKGSLDSYVQMVFTIGRSKMRLLTLNEAVKDKELVNIEVCFMIYTEGLSFNSVKSP